MRQKFSVFSVGMRTQTHKPIEMNFTLEELIYLINTLRGDVEKGMEHKLAPVRRNMLREMELLFDTYQDVANN